eukprot:3611040-Pleurochrysis_carterae.AAC.1
MPNALLPRASWALSTAIMQESSYHATSLNCWRSMACTRPPVRHTFISLTAWPSARSVPSWN